MPKYEVILPVDLTLKLIAEDEEEAMEMAQETWYDAGTVDITVPAGSDIFVRELSPGERLHHD
ncbi:MAG: hypothetical protein ACYCW5_02335 [Thermoleophilia bacterium]